MASYGDLAKAKHPTPELKIGEVDKYGNVRVAVWEVRKHDIEVWFTGTQFRSDFEGKQYSHTKLEDLIENLKEATRRAAVKLEIPFSYQRGQKILDGVITGIHGSNRNILVRWNEDPNPTRSRLRSKSALTEQLSHSYNDPFYQPLDEAKKNELLALLQAERDAEAAVRRFNIENKIDPVRVIEVALETGRDEPEAPVIN